MRNERNEEEKKARIHPLRDSFFKEISSTICYSKRSLLNGSSPTIEHPQPV